MTLQKAKKLIRRAEIEAVYDTLCCVEGTDVEVTNVEVKEDMVSADIKIILPVPYAGWGGKRSKTYKDQNYSLKVLKKYED